jgi:hypothetical protein
MGNQLNKQRKDLWFTVLLAMPPLPVCKTSSQPVAMLLSSDTGFILNLSHP